MENTATKTIIKTEQHHGDVGESKSAAGKVIAVDVDPVALDCLRCLHPLVPPVLQCAAGHVVCSSCHSKCASCFVKTGCFIPTGHNRCHAVERLLQPIHCCTGGNILYHEKTGQEKTCPSAACSGSIAGPVVKMGPCGGAGGDAREMEGHNANRIVKLDLWHGIMVDAMMVLYELGGPKTQIELWGCPHAANHSEICLEPDEYLTSVRGHLGDCKGWLRIRSLTLVSNRRTFGPYGTEEGFPFELPAAGGRIIGFHGRSGTFLDALDTYVKMDVQPLF